MGLPEALYRASETRELDRIAIETSGIPGLTLMERAGQAGFDLLRIRWPRSCDITVVCGRGNNGGDGYIVARLVHEAGLNPQVITVSEPGDLKGDARTAYETYRDTGGEIVRFAPDNFPRADMIVDAVFGTGLERELDGVWYAAIEAINQQQTVVLSLDVPSGLNADTGAIMGAAVTATATLSFIGLNVGLLTGSGPDVSGEVMFADLGVPKDVYGQVKPAAIRLSSQRLRGILPARRPSTHKGANGRVLVFGGAPGMAGAARLAGEAAYRAGAGMVSIGTHPDHAGSLHIDRPELMCHAVADQRSASQLTAWGEVLLVGPGLGQTAWGRELFLAALDTELPLVVDADGLNLLAEEPTHKDHWLLTPHPGEAARLLQTSVAEIQRDRLAAARTISDRYGGVCVLKGAGTVIAVADDELVSLCHRGNAGMAVAGMGDILSGLLAALVGQGLSLYNAARLGVWVHAAAGDQVRDRQGEIGMLASDLLPAVRDCLNRLQ